MPKAPLVQWWAGAQGVTFSGSQEGQLCGFPGPTSWLPASSLACLWVTPGAGPGAVTRPRGPSASLAFVSNDWRATGKGRAMVGGSHRAGRHRKQEGLQQSTGLPSAPRAAVVLVCPFQEREAGRAGGSQERCTRNRAQDSRTALTPGHMGVQEQRWTEPSSHRRNRIAGRGGWLNGCGLLGKGLTPAGGRPVQARRPCVAIIGATGLRAATTGPYLYHRLLYPQAVASRPCPGIPLGSVYI